MCKESTVDFLYVNLNFCSWLNLKTTCETIVNSLNFAYDSRLTDISYDDIRTHGYTILLLKSKKFASMHTSKTHLVGNNVTSFLEP